MGACSGISNFAGFGVINKGLKCVGDSTDCISRREAALAAMMADGAHGWVYDVPDGRAYLTGVRAMAYQKLLPSLTCKEIQHGIIEMESAPAVLMRDYPSGGDPALISRAKILSSSVNGDLAKRYRKNCKRKSKS